MNEKPTTQEDFKKGITTIDIAPYQRQYEVKKHEILTNKHRYPDPEIMIPLTDEVGNPLLDSQNKPRFEKRYRSLIA